MPWQSLSHYSVVDITNTLATAVDHPFQFECVCTAQLYTFRGDEEEALIAPEKSNLNYHQVLVQTVLIICWGS